MWCGIGPAAEPGIFTSIVKLLTLVAGFSVAQLTIDDNALVLWNVPLAQRPSLLARLSSAAAIICVSRRCTGVGVVLSPRFISCPR
jgi:hypothetical protein